MKFFPDKIRIRDSAESRILSNLRFEFRVCYAEMCHIIKLYPLGAPPCIFSKTICVILSFFPSFSETLLDCQLSTTFVWSNMIEFADILATEFS